MKYKAIVVKKEAVYLDAENGNICFPTDNEKLIDGFNGTKEKYIFTEIFTKLFTVGADKVSILEATIWAEIEELKIGYSFEVHRVK